MNSVLRNTIIIEVGLYRKIEACLIFKTNQFKCTEAFMCHNYLVRFCSKALINYQFLYRIIKLCNKKRFI
ncbi:hypothetical protein BpHYR1_050677 [Brachionus plicatilis]|uniref:Uncharacterized protein n=1 Tax=Brachionus plicatilis TaxID=10195 RepID=A0A3M7SM29_BRAPC|nr:hypothetical protein BpHYR1_050677 [Brachionus plicatilis]